MNIEFRHLDSDNRNINKMFLNYIYDKWDGQDWFKNWFEQRRNSLALEFAELHNLSFHIETDEANNETLVFTAKKVSSVF